MIAILTTASTELPDYLNKQSQSSSAIPSAQLLFVLVAFVVVLVLAYYFTKFIARSRLGLKGSTNIKVLESVAVGYQSTVQLVKVADEYMLIGVTKDKITFLTNVKPDNLRFQEQAQTVVPFEKYLSGFFNNKPK